MKKMNKLLLTLLSLLLAVGLIGQSEPLKLKPGDVVFVTVYGRAEYTGDYQVASDGSISGRGFGSVVVANLTLAEAQSAVRKALLKVLRHPLVNISLRDQKPFYVSVVGARHPSGSIPHTPGMTLRHLIAICELPLDPDLLEATLYRVGEPPRSIDLVKLLRSDSQEWNGPILANDLLVIQPLRYVRVWVGGEVITSGDVKIREGGDLAQAISNSGGPRALHGFADELEVRVKRGDQVYTYTLAQAMGGSISLQDGDRILLVGPEYITVTVGGKVREPGIQTLRAGGGIQEAIARAKGVTENATLSSVLIYRNGSVLTADETATLFGEPRQNVTLHHNDIVYVRENRNVVYVLGNVSKPGRYAIPDGQIYRATNALADAEGLTEKGTLRRVHLARIGQDGAVAITQFHLDEFLKGGNDSANPVLKPGDILLFTEPKGITIDTINRFVSALFFLDTIIKR